MSADTEAASDPSPESAWSPRAGWTEPLRRRRATVAAAVLAVEAVLAWRVGLQPALAAFLYLGLVGTALGIVDAGLRRLPDPLTLPSYPVGAALLGAAAPFTGDGGGRFLDALLGCAALWAFFAVQWFVMPRALGFGDVKLSGVLGLYLGWLGMDAWVLGVFAMFILAGLYSAGLLILRRVGRKESIPFGPFMLLGTLAGVLAHG